MLRGRSGRVGLVYRVCDGLCTDAYPGGNKQKDRRVWRVKQLHVSAGLPLQKCGPELGFHKQANRVFFAVTCHVRPGTVLISNLSDDSSDQFDVEVTVLKQAV